MKIKSLLKGILFLILGIGILSGVVYSYTLYKGISISDFISTLSESDVAELINPRDNNLYLSTSLPDELSTSLQQWAEEDHIVVEFSGELEDGVNYVVSSEDIGEYDLAWKRYYIPVVSIKSFLTNIPQESFNQLMAGNNVVIEGVTYSLVIDSESMDFFESNFEMGASVQTSDDIVNEVYSDTSLIGLTPFEELSPKVLPVSVNNQHIWQNFDKDEYPFVEEVWVWEDEGIGLFEQVQESMGEINYDPELLSTVVVTGTSVMGGRGLYFKSEELGDWIYPIREVAPILSEADISHISNESVFVSGCTQSTGTLIFCGPIEAFDAFTFAGVDVVGLTGNHIMDYGDTRFLQTLQLYTNNGIEYFGGGENYTDAHTPAVIEVNGMSFAFLGYNIIPPVSSYATEYEPGSAQLEMNSLVSDIENASATYDFVLVDMQWGNEYQHDPLSYQQEYGRAAIDAGADVVTGVHPHWVQKLEYYNDGVIFYGIGNLLFDQMWSQKTREGLMVRHYFYGGRHLGFEFEPTIIYEGAQPRPVDSKEDYERIVNYLF